LGPEIKKSRTKPIKNHRNQGKTIACLLVMWMQITKPRLTNPMKRKPASLASIVLKASRPGW